MSSCSLNYKQNQTEYKGNHIFVFKTLSIRNTFEYIYGMRFKRNLNIINHNIRFCHLSRNFQS